MDVLPCHLRELQFDHDAAFRASWAIDELIARVDHAAANRAAAAEHILGSCEGPFADHLGYQVKGAGTDAGMVVAGLRRLQRQIDDARDAAFLEDAARSAAADWQAEQALSRDVEARAAQALRALGSPVRVSAARPALPN